MKKFIGALSLLLLSTSVFAWTIGPMNYQGRLLDNAGVPVTGSYNFKVRIYDAVSGGTLKFSEQHNSVAVDDGVYSFLVSTGTSPTGTWDINLWNTATLYLEIEVNGETLTPRHLLASTPFAFQANLALTTNNALALGGKSATEYNNTLAAICESSRGKWLELVGKCLGVGASFPGPAMVNLNTLTASTDLSGLDLSKADISGIDFGNANLSGATLKDTTVKLDGIMFINLTGAILDDVHATAPGTFNGNLTNAFISNMDLGYWSLSGATLTGISAGLLNGCPSSIPLGYKCAGKDTGGGDWRYVITGPGVNLSETSVMKNHLNATYMYQWMFSGVSLSGADFTGNSLRSLLFYSDANFTNAKFKRTDIRNLEFAGSMGGAVFDDATIKSTTFQVVNFTPSASFVGADLSFVLFNSISDYSVLDFTSAIVANVEIRGSGIPGYGQHMSLNFNNSRISNLLISAELDSLTLVNSAVAGGLTLPPYPVIPSIVIGGQGNVVFQGGVVAGNFTNANFSGTVFYSVSFRGANLTGSTGTFPSSYINADWYGAICPDGFSVTTPGGTCIGHGI